MSRATLYQASWCPSSARARRALQQRGRDYDSVEVPLRTDERNQLEQVSGQREIPVLVADDKIVIGADDIEAFLLGR